MRSSSRSKGRSGSTCARSATTSRSTSPTRGPALPTEDLPRLFERFHRIEGARSRSSRRVGHRARIRARARAHAWRHRAREEPSRGGHDVDRCPAARPPASAQRACARRAYARGDGARCGSLRRGGAAMASGQHRDDLRSVGAALARSSLEPTGGGHRARVDRGGRRQRRHAQLSRARAWRARGRPGVRRWRAGARGHSGVAAGRGRQRRHDAVPRRPRSPACAPSRAPDGGRPRAPAVGASRRKREDRGGPVRRGRLHRQAVLRPASSWRASARKSTSRASEASLWASARSCTSSSWKPPPRSPS